MPQRIRLESIAAS